VSTSAHPWVTREEAIAVADELEHPPEGLVGIKTSPDDGWELFSAPPDLADFDGPKQFMITYPYAQGGSTQRPALRYDSPNGSLVVVAHETGAAIWAAVEHTATVVGLLGGVVALWDRVRAGRPTGAGEPPDKITVDKDGNIVASDPWDERSL
jgi:hypothetical protein